MKFLILGATGMAGHVIAYYLQEQGHEVVGFSRTPLQGIKSVIGSINDVAILENLIHNNSFDVVVNCIGILNSACDKDIRQAIYANAIFPHILLDIVKGTATNIIHLSTDCVFSGNNGPYLEESVLDGSSLYAITKGLGEIISEQVLVLRTSIIGPDMRKAGIGLFNWFMAQTQAIFGFTNVIWSGVTTLTLAKSIEAASEHDVFGLYHLVNNYDISKYALLDLCNNVCRKNQIGIIKKDEPFNNKMLLNTREDFIFEVPDYEEMVREMHEWIKKHQYLYNYKGEIK